MTNEFLDKIAQHVLPNLDYHTWSEYGKKTFREHLYEIINYYNEHKGEYAEDGSHDIR